MININQAGVGYYLHREGPNLGKNIVSLVSCYHPTLTHSSGPNTRDPPVLTPTAIKVCAGLGPADAEHLSKHEWKQARKSQNSNPSYYNKLKFIKLKQVSGLPEALAFSSAG